MIKFKTLRHALMMTAATLGGTMAATVADRPAYAQEAVRAYAIPAQNLDDALRVFAMQTGRDVLYPPQVVAGKRSPGVQGQRTERQALTALLAGTGLRFERTASGGYAVQDPASPTRAGEAGEMAASELEDVVVTGTNIRGSAAIGSPVVVITQEDIERSGAQTPAQLLESLTQNFGGGVSLDVSSDLGTLSTSLTSQQGGVSSGSPDQSFGTTPNLRGLGQGRTLVLVNGRRLTTAAAQSNGRPYVDVSQIPLSAIERVEVLTDGASAIYGADAVAGVINFILKRDYVGAQTRLSAGAGDGGVGAEYRLAQTFGYGWSDGNALVTLERYHHDAVTYDELSIFPTGGILSNGPFVTGDIAPEETSNAISASLSQDLSSTARAHADLAYADRETNFHRHGVQSFGAFGNYDQDQVTQGTSERWSVNLGLDLEPFPTWNARINAGLSRDDFEYNSVNLELAPGFGLNSTTLFRQVGRSELGTFDAVADGQIFSLPGGPARLATGYQYRTEAFDFFREQNGVIGSVQNPDSVTTHAVFAEIEAPVLAPLDGRVTPFVTLSLAGRYEEYSNFGDSFDPRYGIRIAPTDDLSFRASYSTSFKPPSVQQLQPPNTISAAWFPDPSEPDGYLRIISVFGGGNPDLQPETSTNWTAGFDWKLRNLNDLELQFTLYDIEYVNRIFTPVNGIVRVTDFNDPTLDSIRIRRSDLPDAEFNALVNALLTNPYGARFESCNRTIPPSPFPPVITAPCNEPATNIEAIAYRGLMNVAGSHDRGLDLALRQELNTVIGRVRWGVAATYIFDHEQQVTSDTPMVDHIDQVGFPIDFNARGTLGWSRDAWSIDTVVDYSDSYRNTWWAPAKKIDSYTTVDLSVRYDTGRRFGSPVLNDLSIIFHVQNLFEAKPPFVDYPFANVDFRYDPNNANPNLRRFSLSLVKEW